MMKTIVGFSGMVRVVSKPNRGKDFAGTFKVSIAGPGVPDAPGVKALNGLVAELTWHNYGLKKASVEGADILVEGIMGLVFSKKKYHLVIYADQIHRIPPPPCAMYHTYRYKEVASEPYCPTVQGTASFCLQTETLACFKLFLIEITTGGEKFLASNGPVPKSLTFNMWGLLHITDSEWDDFDNSAQSTTKSPRTVEFRDNL